MHASGPMTLPPEESRHEYFTLFVVALLTLSSRRRRFLYAVMIVRSGRHRVTDGLCEAYGDAVVVALGRATVRVYGGARVIAHDNATIYAFDVSVVDASDRVMIHAFDSTTVRASGNATVLARGVALIHSEFGDPEVTVSDSAVWVDRRGALNVHVARSDEEA